MTNALPYCRSQTSWSSLTCSPNGLSGTSWAGCSFSRFLALGSAPRLSSNRTASTWAWRPCRALAMCSAVFPLNACQSHSERSFQALGLTACRSVCHTKLLTNLSIYDREVVGLIQKKAQKLNVSLFSSHMQSGAATFAVLFETRWKCSLEHQTQWHLNNVQNNEQCSPSFPAKRPWATKCLYNPRAASSSAAKQDSEQRGVSRNSTAPALQHCGTGLQHGEA